MEREEPGAPVAQLKAPVAPEPEAEADLAALRAGVVRYYSDRVRRHGCTPLGVDWTCIAAQELRFVQLMKLCDFSAPFSLNDVGCGYGALVAYLLKRHGDAVKTNQGIDYLGIDLAEAMIRRARERWRRQPWAAFVTGDAHARPADYSVASGIFNVKLEQPRGLWERYVARTLDDMQANSRKGFAVNFMRERPPSPSPAPPSPVRDGAASDALYRSSPEQWVTHCEREYGAAVTLIENYGQPEYTLLARPRDAASRT